MRLDFARIEDALREHVGAFAPIVLQDAIKAAGLDMQAPRPRDLPAFWVALGYALPVEVDRRAVVEQLQRTCVSL
jgi:hypothetical protein